jgi:hypothetical protein
MAITVSTVTTAVDLALAQIATAETEIKNYQATGDAPAAKCSSPLKRIVEARQALQLLREEFIGGGQAHNSFT